MWHKTLWAPMLLARISQYRQYDPNLYGPRRAGFSKGDNLVTTNFAHLEQALDKHLQASIYQDERSFPEDEHSQRLAVTRTIADGRASLPVGCAAFKAVEVRIRAWWVRLLPLPPHRPPAPSVRITDHCPAERSIILRFCYHEMFKLEYLVFLKSPAHRGEIQRVEIFQGNIFLY
jgi:hypothetical protein